MSCYLHFSALIGSLVVVVKRLAEALDKADKLFVGNAWNGNKSLPRDFSIAFW